MADIKCQNYIHKYKCLEYVLNHNACEECECRVRNPVIEELEKIKAEFEQYRDRWNYYGNEYEMTKYETYDFCIDEIDERISELKGENNERYKL